MLTVETVGALKPLLFLNVTGVRLSVEGLDNIPKDGPCVFVANHRSYYDIPLLLAGLDEPYGILAKEEPTTMASAYPPLNKGMKRRR